MHRMGPTLQKYSPASAPATRASPATSPAPLHPHTGWGLQPFGTPTKILTHPQNPRGERKSLHISALSSLPVLTPQLELGGPSPPALPPHAALPGTQTVPFSTFLTPYSLLSPSLTARGYFSSRSRPASKPGLPQHLLAGGISIYPEELHAFLSLLRMTLFPFGTIQKWDEKGKYYAGHSKAKDTGIFQRAQWM